MTKPLGNSGCSMQVPRTVFWQARARSWWSALRQPPSCSTPHRTPWSSWMSWAEAPPHLMGTSASVPCHLSLAGSQTVAQHHLHVRNAWDQQQDIDMTLLDLE